MEDHKATLRRLLFDGSARRLQADRSVVEMAETDAERLFSDEDRASLRILRDQIDLRQRELRTAQQRFHNAHDSCIRRVLDVEELPDLKAGD